MPQGRKLKKKFNKSKPKPKTNSNNFVYDEETKKYDEKHNIVRNEKGYVTTKIKKNIHEFWEKQPVRQITEVITDEGEIDNSHIKNETQVNLEEVYYWDDLDPHDSQKMNELQEFLAENYVEDTKSEFRLSYKASFLKRLLTGPTMTLSIGFRNKENNKLMGYISGIEVLMSYNNVERRTTDINFLCLDKSLRKTGYAQKLIMEATRRSNLNDIWQGIFTGARKLPTPYTKMKYYHRPINYKKLVDVKFVNDSNKSSQKEIKHMYFTREAKLDKRFKKMEEKHYESAHEVLSEYLQQYAVHQVFNLDEFIHHFANDENVVSYVIENDNGEVEDFISYYKLRSKLLNHKKHKEVQEAYLYMYSSDKFPIDHLLNNIITIAQRDGVDVFNALTQMETKSQMLTENKFLEGTGNLNAYVYNWKLADIIPHFVAKAVV